MNEIETTTITTSEIHINGDAVLFVLLGIFFVFVGIGIDRFLLAH